MLNVIIGQSNEDEEVEVEKIDIKRYYNYDRQLDKAMKMKR